MRFNRVIALGLFFSSVALQAQDDNMFSWLNHAKPVETTDRLVSLGVHKDVAEQVTIAESPLIQWRPIRTESQQTSAIMFLPCTALGAHLYLMVHKMDWRVSDTVDLECYYDDSVSFELASIRKAKIDEVLIHHASEGHGTGFSQQNFKVFRITDGKLKTVLDTEEVVLAAPYDGPERHEHSVFVVVPDQSTKSPGQIEQTRSVLVGDTLSVQRRYFYWKPPAGRYTPSRFIAVSPKHD